MHLDASSNAPIEIAVVTVFAPTMKAYCKLCIIYCFPNNVNQSVVENRCRSESNNVDVRAPISPCRKLMRSTNFYPDHVAIDMSYPVHRSACARWSFGSQLLTGKDEVHKGCPAVLWVMMQLYV